MAYDEFHPGSVCAPCQPSTPSAHKTARDTWVPRTLHLLPCTLQLHTLAIPVPVPGPVLRRTLVRAKVDTLQIPFCFSTVPERYDVTHSLNLKPRGLSIHRC